MDLEAKVRSILAKAFCADVIHLDAEDGISGYVVSSRFEGFESLDRQRMLDEAFRNGGLSNEELREVIMISALTPAEAVGVPML